MDEDYLFIKTGCKIPVIMGGENMMGGGRWEVGHSRIQATGILCYCTLQPQAHSWADGRLSRFWVVS